MNTSRCVASAFLLFAASITVSADWKGKPFPKWSDGDVARVVTDSPWAKSKKVNLTWVKREPTGVDIKDIPGTTPSSKLPSGMSPVGGIGVPRNKLPSDADMIVRWASALPVRQAKALFKYRNEKTGTENPSDLISAPEPGYVVEIYGAPAEVAHNGTESVEAVAYASAYLRTAKGRTIRPNRVDAKLSALSVTIFVHFPRTEPIQTSDNEVEFFVDMQIFSVREKFKVDQMKYLGHLEM